MTPAGAGRHCAACQQVVIDFTAMTDGELAAYLARPGRVPCGRFRASQLGRVLRPAARPVVGWRRWWGAVAAVLGLGALATPARAQGRPARPSTAQQPGPQGLLGRPVRPAATKPACAPAAVAHSERLLLGEPMLAGAPVATPVPTKAKPRK